jgi:hypothetical protein
LEKLVVENKNMRWEYEQQFNLGQRRLEIVTGEIDTREVQFVNEIHALKIDV